MKVGYEKFIGDSYLRVVEELPDGRFVVETGFDFGDGERGGEEEQEFSTAEIQRWESETQADLDRQWQDNPTDEFGRPLVQKTCVGCGMSILVIATYDVCDSCADKREHGFDI